MQETGNTLLTNNAKDADGCRTAGRRGRGIYVATSCMTCLRLRAEEAASRYRSTRDNCQGSHNAGDWMVHQQPMAENAKYKMPQGVLVLRDIRHKLCNGRKLNTWLKEYLYLRNRKDITA